VFADMLSLVRFLNSKWMCPSVFIVANTILTTLYVMVRTLG